MNVIQTVERYVSRSHTLTFQNEWAKVLAAEIVSEQQSQQQISCNVSIVS